MNRLRRRLVLSASALFAVQRIAFAQQSARMWRVAFIGGAARQASHDEFARGMRELGYQEAKSYVIEWRFADGHFERLPALAADLIDKRVDVIVVDGTPAAVAVRRATSTTPVVMAVVGDPVGSGLVASLARPGGNFTGLSLANPEVATKWFELARTLAPQSRIGVLANTDPAQQTGPGYIRSIQAAGEKVGTKVLVADARSAGEIESALASLARQRVTTVIVLPNGVFTTNAQQISQFMLKHRMASIGTARIFVERGLLLSYGQSYDAFYRRAATYVDKILKGAKPGDLAVEQPTLLELAINLRTAKALGLTIPKELLLRADKTIE